MTALSPKHAAAWMLHESLYPSRDRTNECLRTVRIALGVPSGADWAIHAWDAALAARNTHQVALPAPGTPYFFKGSGKYGHIVLVDVNQDANRTVDSTYVWSTDIKRPGKVDRVTIGYIKRHWGMRGLGWTSVLNGVAVPGTK